MNGAIISECGRYRYVLTRGLNTPLRHVKPVLFIMLNPSTADAIEDDPTIRRCIYFAEREGCTSLAVVNLFALRATNPNDLMVAENPEGAENNFHIAEQVKKHRLGLIIAAWGSNKFARFRADFVCKNFGPFLCLGRTKNGSPRHPLYLAKTTPLESLLESK